MKNEIYNLYRAAIAEGLCKSQKEFAELVGLNPSTISLAIKGDERYLTDSIIYKVRKALAAHNIHIKGDAAVIDTNNGVGVQKNFAPTDFADLLRTSQKQIDTLLAQQAEFLKIITNLSTKI